MLLYGENCFYTLIGAAETLRQRRLREMHIRGTAVQTAAGCICSDDLEL